MNKTIIWVFSGVVGLGLVVWMAYALAGEEPPDPSVGFRDVEVEGTSLPQFEPPQPDPAIGEVVPTVRGVDWNGNAVAIEPDGRPKVVVFLAHWCQFCQQEVPVLQNWIDGGGEPDDVDLYAVTIMSSSTRVLWPPQDWLEDEGWTVPTLMDSQAREVELAYGARATPYYMVLDGENRNIGRMSGVIGVSGFEALIESARTGLPGS